MCIFNKKVLKLIDMVYLNTLFLVGLFHAQDVWIFINPEIQAQCPWLATMIFTIGLMLMILDVQLYPNIIQRAGFVPILALEFVLLKGALELSEKFIWLPIVNYIFEGLPDLLDLIPIPIKSCRTKIIYGGDCEHKLYYMIGGCTFSTVITYLAAIFCVTAGIVIKRRIKILIVIILEVINCVASAATTVIFVPFRMVRYWKRVLFK